MKPEVVPEESERWITVIAVLGQRHTRVQGRDLGVVPGLDLADEDVAERLAVELQAALDTGQVVGDGDRAQEHRDLHGGAAVLGDRFFVCRLQRRVAGAEVDDLALDRRDARAGADGLVVDGQARTAPRPTVRRRERRTSSPRRRSCPSPWGASWRSWRPRCCSWRQSSGAVELLDELELPHAARPEREQRTTGERAQLVLDH